MRATIRHTIPGHTTDDVNKAMRELKIDDAGMYRELMVIKELGQPDAVRESVLPGIHVRRLIRIQLQESMNQVEQDEPTEIVLRWTRPTKRNHYRTRSCTYSQVS
ncbi:hypothetical protein [Streptomyces sanglieri]|uniref:hypothetical protein n=1 Tax=Streptomyces sanglieri TaxID=193460 RepID=UPI003523314E